MRTQRPRGRIATVFPLKSTRLTIHNPASEIDVLWRMIEQFGVDRRLASRAMPDARFTAHWSELRSYLRQARVYDDAASTVSDISAGLLLYYSQLQLAKCELLAKRPGAVFNKRIGHGLSYSPERARTIAGDYVTVAPGVFRELYEARIGRSIAVGTKLRVRDLLSLVPDVGLEVEAAGIGSRVLTESTHLVASDASHCWYVLIADRRSTAEYASVHRYLKQSFDPVVPINRGPIPEPDHCEPFQVMYESRRQVPIASPELTTSDFEAAISSVDLRCFNSIPLYGRPVFSPGLRKTSLVPITSDLARYALTYYVSSLVRYKPSRLDDRSNAASRWVLEAFVSEARPHLLRSALFGLSGQVAVFDFGSRM